MLKMELLTARQWQLLQLCVDHADETGKTPSMRSLQQLAKIKSPTTVRTELQQLAELGFLHQSKKGYRSYYVTSMLRDIGFNISEAMAACVPIPQLGLRPNRQAVTNLANPVVVPRNLLKAGEPAAAMIVSDDAMAPQGINNGDIAVLSLDSDFVENTLAAIVSPETKRLTIREIRQIYDELWAVPADDTYGVWLAREVEVIGTITGVMRSFYSPILG